MAREGLAQHLFRSRKSQSQCHPRRCAQASRSRWNDHARTSSALHPQQSRRQHHHSRHAQTPQRRIQSRRQRQRPPARAAPRAIAQAPLGPHSHEVEPINDHRKPRPSFRPKRSGGRNLSLWSQKMDMSRGKTTRFVSRRARRASGNARLARSAILRDRCARAACCEVHPQSPAPSAPQLFVCLRFSSRPRLPAFFRRRISQVSARISHPALLGWSTLARKSQLLSARSWSLRASLSAQYHIRSRNKSLPPACASCAKSHLHFFSPSLPCEFQPVGLPSPRIANSPARTRSASWPPSLVPRNPPLRRNALSGSCHSIGRRRDGSQRQPCPSLPTAAGRCSLPSKSSPFFGARNGNKQSKARLPRT